jgi:hypothetical protein
MILLTSTGGGELALLEIVTVVVVIWLVAPYFRTPGAGRKLPGFRGEVPGYICRNCGNAVDPIRSSNLNGCFLVALLCFFIIPGILYWVWAGTQTVLKCPHCNAKNNFVPLGSPEGQRMAGFVPQQRTSERLPDRQRRERLCPWCAESILTEARVCKHCHRDVSPIS